jgi:histidyl-tRNA synthetase|tara:strand:+ start:1005 stop:2267 length:1263 start_codon:yes stop_codon:yes gene_type:complete
MSKIQTLRGMNDIDPQQSKVWAYIEGVLRSVVESYGYEEIRFPVVEKTELYTRSNEAADIVTKEMYTFQDKGGESISLRPEGTAGCVRAAIDNDLIRTEKPRLWYTGPMFRYERPQKGRSRQFHQFSAEVFGINSPEIDAELILMSARFWKELGLTDNVRLELNNLGNEKTRNSYSQALVEFLKNQKEDLDEDTKRKLIENPLRILDSKSPLVQNLLEKAPSIEDYINEDSKKYQLKLLELLERHGIEFNVNPKLVRGLDYYNQTVFEWKTALLGSQDTVLGGGRYDNLVQELGGKSCPAVGFSIGLERLILLLQEQSELNIENNLDIYFICLSEGSAEEAIMYSEKLKNEFPSLRIKTNLGLESANSQFKKADKSGAKIALILGKEELESKKISYKDLRTKSDQESLTFEEILKKLKNK